MNLDDLVSRSRTKISKSCSLQLRQILILLKYRSLGTKIHTPPFCRLWRLKIDPNIASGNVRCSRSSPSIWCSIKHSTWGSTLYASKEFITSSVSLLNPLMAWLKICSELYESTVLSWFKNSRHLDHTHSPVVCLCNTNAMIYSV